MAGPVCLRHSETASERGGNITRFRARREQFKSYARPLPSIQGQQGQNLALTVLHAPYSLNSETAQLRGVCGTLGYLSSSGGSFQNRSSQGGRARLERSLGDAATCGPHHANFTRISSKFLSSGFVSNCGFRCQAMRHTICEPGPESKVRAQFCHFSIESHLRCSRFGRGIHDDIHHEARGCVWPRGVYEPVHEP